MSHMLHVMATWTCVLGVVFGLLCMAFDMSLIVWCYPVAAWATILFVGSEIVGSYE